MLRALRELILRVVTGLRIRLAIDRKHESVAVEAPWLELSYSFNVDWFIHVNADDPRIVRRGIE